MGTPSFENVPYLSLVTGIVRSAVSSNGQRDGAEAYSTRSKRIQSVTSTTLPEEKSNKEKLVNAYNEATRLKAFAAVYYSLEKLRIAAKEAILVFDMAIEAGIAPETMIQALRIEHQDWTDYLDEMQRASELLDAAGARTSIELLIMVDRPISKSTDKFQFARDQGYLAQVIGRFPENNPYSPAHVLHDSWVLGFKEAKRLLKQEKQVRKNAAK